MSLFALCCCGLAAIIAAGPRRLPRDGQPRTPSGLEGSSGSGDAGCRGAAGADHFTGLLTAARAIH